MIRTTTLATVLMTLVCAAVPASGIAQEPANLLPTTPNAALKYWTAFALLDAADPKAIDLDGAWSDGPLTDEERAELLKLDPAFDYLHRAALIENCDWELDLAEGPGLMLPHLSETRRMYRCAVYRARLHLADGETDQAIQLMADVATLGRRVGHKTMYVCCLVGIVTEEVALEFVAREIVKPGASPESIASLERAWSQLPPAGKAADCVACEASWFPTWLQQQFTAGKSPDDLAQRWPGLARALGGIAADAQIAQIKPFYDQIVEISQLPRAEREQRLVTLRQDIKKAPMAELLLPAVESLLEAADRLEVKRAMLQAGIDVARRGPAALQDHDDPASPGHSFAYEAQDNGFLLRSALILRSRANRPVELQFGSAGESR